jgi:peptidoglycan hydrolase CwlO-like protein
MSNGNQAGYAVVAAAFITGLWAFIAQKFRSIGESEKEEANVGVQDRQNLIQNYREFNTQLQSRINSLNEEVISLWNNLNSIQKLLDESEEMRNKHTRQIIDLEGQVNSLTINVEECRRDKNDLERENSRLYRLLSAREISGND